jgi:hypothetical protein
MICAWNLPYPVGVSTNHLYQGLGRGRTLTKAARAWRDTVILHIRQQAIDGKEKLELPPGNLAIWIDAWPPNDHRIHDAGNLEKFTTDSVMAAFGEKDERIRECHTQRLARSDRPSMHVMVMRSRITGD